jgi:general secretion pathway protein A
MSHMSIPQERPPLSEGANIGGRGAPKPASQFLIYCDHFGLSCRPFSLLPDPDFLFWSNNHSRTYAMLEYGLATFAPITVITGEVGAGKTTLIRHLLRDVAQDLRIGLVSNAHGERGQLLHWVLASLHQRVDEWSPYVSRFASFEALLRAEAAEGRHTVLIIDEAQNLSERMLEELRCYSNLNCEGSELLQIILVGQPDLLQVIGRPRMQQFMQRVSARFHLAALPLEAVHQYVGHRLKVAGASREIFMPEACDLVFEASRGVPRIINQLCDYGLVYAFAEGAETVGAEIIAKVVEDRRIQIAATTPRAR